MFEWLAKYRQIFVTGPQRSGTTICARMIAQDAGHTLLLEEEIHTDSLNVAYDLWRNGQRIVLQCPALARYIHHFSRDDVAIIYMRREVSDIIKSQARVRWEYSEPEQWRFDERGEPAELKYAAWQWQKPLIANAFEIEYESLTGHPLWTAPEQRRQFGPRQTE